MLRADLLEAERRILNFTVRRAHEPHEIIVEGLTECGVCGTEHSVGSLSSLERCDDFSHALFAGGLFFVNGTDGFRDLLFEVRELLLQVVQIDGACFLWLFLTIVFESNAGVFFADE